MVRMHDMAAEAVLIGAGGRSILLQLADPAIGRGVANHSDFTSRPLDRLAGTLSYVYAVSCGTPEEAVAAARRVNRAHGPVHGPASTGPAPVHGTANGSAHGEGPAYNAFTPELQLWVAATLYDSAIVMHELIYGPLDERAADAVYQEYAGLGTALQLPRELWPPDRAAFGVYWRAQLSRLGTDVATRAVARQLLHPPTGPLWLRLAMPLGRLLTIGLLPAEVRDLFELPWGPTEQARFDRAVRVMARVYPTLPRRIRHWPKDHYLRVLRASP